MTATRKPKRRFPPLFAALGMLALVGAGSGAAEDGNIATDSIGTVQIGSTGVEAGAAVTSPAEETGAAARAALGSGGNDARGAIGTVQAGGANSASRSVGTAQAGSGAAATEAGATAAGSEADGRAPLAVAPGDNQASGTIATAQVGGGNSASDRIGSAHVRGLEGSAEASASSGQSSPLRVEGPIGADVGSDGVAADALDARSEGLFDVFRADSIVPVVKDAIDAALATLDPVADASFSLDREIEIDLATATVQVRSLDAEPAVAGEVEPLGTVSATSPVRVAPNGGNSSTGSFGTVQLGPTSAAPTFTLGLDPLETSVALGGETTVGGDGTNSSTDSIGTAQAGGGNAASDSIGTAQAGSVATEPSLAASSPYAYASTGERTAIGGGGGNAAASSLGTGQIGGGNAEDSSGTIQAGAVSVSPTAELGESATGRSLTLGETTAIGGSGEPNVSDGSAGAVQIGAGNNSAGSIGTFQIGSGGPARSASPPPDERTLALSTPPSAAGSSDAEARILARAGQRPSDKPVAQQGRPAGKPKPQSGTLRTIAGAFPSIRGTLPFTGGSLALLLGLGLALVATGLGLRTLTVVR